MKQTLQTICQDNAVMLKDLFEDDALFNEIEKISQTIITALNNGNKILLCGNGGSAADAQHIAGEFIGRFKLERKSLPAIALTTDTSILTCIANDYSFADIFSRQVEGLGVTGDVLIGISTSGNSRNVHQAVVTANTMGLQTIAFTGKDGGSIKEDALLTCHIAHDNTPFIQSAHEIILHAICEVVEKAMVV